MEEKLLEDCTVNWSRIEDENGRKNSISTSVSIFFVEMKAGSENTGLKTESEYANIRKRTNTDGEPKN
jgi:hypothetical protein